MKVYLEDLTIKFEELDKDITHCGPKRFYSCTVEDLLPDPGRSMGIGVYCFYDEAKLEYIGKSGGRNVFERMGGHVDHRENAFMNYYLRMLAVKKAELDWGNHKEWQGRFTQIQRQDMLTDVMSALSEKSLAIIYLGRDLDRRICEELEKLLTLVYMPLLQKQSRRKVETKGKTIRELLYELATNEKKELYC